MGSLFLNVLFTHGKAFPSKFLYSYHTHNGDFYGAHTSMKKIHEGDQEVYFYVPDIRLVKTLVVLGYVTP
jgi:hypothetical protein